MKEAAMIAIEKLDSLSELSELKQAYFAQSTAPLDGMWHFGFVPMAKHYGFYHHQNLVGFCCINDDGYLLQFYLTPEVANTDQELFTLIAENNSAVIGQVKGAFASTAEPNYQALCLDNSTSFKVNALMFQHSPELAQKQHTPIEMQAAITGQLAAFVHFAASNIGAPEQWLSQYYGNLITRNELFGYWQHGQLLAAGECRLFDQYQTEYAEVGMIVAQSARGQGIAKQVLSCLIKHGASRGLKAICSTESGNIAAQKAIYQTGFSAMHRIVQFEFNHK